MKVEANISCKRTLNLLDDQSFSEIPSFVTFLLLLNFSVKETLHQVKLKVLPTQIFCLGANRLLSLVSYFYLHSN